MKSFKSAYDSWIVGGGIALLALAVLAFPSTPLFGDDPPCCTAMCVSDMVCDNGCTLGTVGACGTSTIDCSQLEDSAKCDGCFCHNDTAGTACTCP